MNPRNTTGDFFIFKFKIERGKSIIMTKLSRDTILRYFNQL